MGQAARYSALGFELIEVREYPAEAEPVRASLMRAELGEPLRGAVNFTNVN